MATSRTEAAAAPPRSSRSRSRAAALALTLTLLLSVTPGHTQATPASPDPASSDPAAELQQRTAAQQTARDSGDQAQILTTSRRLAALALRLVGDLDAARHQPQAARDRYRQSLALADDPATHLNLALNELQDSRPDAALAELRPLAAADPGDARIATTLAQAYLEKGDAPAAADTLTRVWQLHPETTTGALLVTADARTHRGEQAFFVARQLVAQNGDSAPLHLLLANAFHAGGDTNGTIAELTQAVALDPDLAPAHLALGGAFWELNEYQYNPDTLREFTAAQRLNPGDALANFNLGSILSQYQRYSEAAPFLTRAAETDPTSPDPWLQLGLNAYAEDDETLDHEAARSRETRSRETQDRETQDRETRNYAAEARTDLEKAITVTGASESRNNFQIRRAYVVLSRIAVEQGRTADAARLAQHADALHAALLRADLPSSLSESTSVTTALSGGNPQPGVKPGDRSQLTAPSSTPGSASPGPGPDESAQQQDLRRQLLTVVAGSLNDAGTALARAHDFAAALPYFRQASAADPTSALALRNLGLAAVHAGSLAEAIPALTRVTDLNPADTVARTYLDQARASQGSPKP